MTEHHTTYCIIGRDDLTDRGEQSLLVLANDSERAARLCLRR